MFGFALSVGGDCQPAHQLRRLTGRREAQVFDWLLIDAAGTAALIEADFDGWLASERLSLRREPFAHVHEARYGTRFLHDFPLDEGFLAGAPRVRAKYEALAERWRQQMRLDAALLFVRHGDEGRDAIAPLAAALRRARGGRPFRLLALRSDRAEPDWGLPDVSNRFLPPAADGAWQGDDRAWDALLRPG